MSSVRKFTFAISSPDEFLVLIPTPSLSCHSLASCCHCQVSTLVGYLLHVAVPLTNWSCYLYQNYFSFCFTDSSSVSSLIYSHLGRFLGSNLESPTHTMHTQVRRSSVRQTQTIACILHHTSYTQHGTLQLSNKLRQRRFSASRKLPRLARYSTQTVRTDLFTIFTISLHHSTAIWHTDLEVQLK